MTVRRRCATPKSSLWLTSIQSWFQWARWRPYDAAAAEKERKAAEASAAVDKNAAGEEGSALTDAASALAYAAARGRGGEATRRDVSPGDAAM